MDYKEMMEKFTSALERSRRCIDGVCDCPGGHKRLELGYAAAYGTLYATLDMAVTNLKYAAMRKGD